MVVALKKQNIDELKIEMKKGRDTKEVTRKSQVLLTTQQARSLAARPTDRNRRRSYSHAPPQ